MGSLLLQNEHTRAVGNMNVNARGDVIDSNNEVINDNNKRVNEYYMKSAMNRGGKSTGINTAPSPVMGGVAPIQQTSMPVPDPISVAEELHPDEMDFDDHDEEIAKEDSKSKKSNSSK
jgi:hypothetical protein